MLRRLRLPAADWWLDRPREIAWLAAAVLVGAAVGLGAVAVPPLLLAGGLLGLAWTLAVLQRPLVGAVTVLLVATLLPFAVVPTSGGGLRPTFLDVALGLTLLAWLLYAVTNPAWRPVGTPLGWPIAGLVLVMVAAFVAGYGYGISSEGVRLVAKLVNSLLFFFGVVQVARTEGDLRRLVAALVVGGGLAALVGIGLYAAPAALAVRALSALRVVGYPDGPDVLRYLADTNVLRATGTSIDPNVFGATLLMTGIFAAAGIAQRRPVLDRRLLVLLAGLIAVCLLLTRSRGSQVGFVAGLGFVALLRYRRLGLAVAGALALAVVALPGELNPLAHLLVGLQAGDRATQMRLGEYKDAFNLIARYPWLGVGFGNAPSLDLYVGVSSAYLLVAEQMGLVGLAAWLGVIGALCLWALTAGVLRRRDEASELAVLALAAVAGALVGALADHHYFNQRFPHTVALLWASVGIAAAAIRLATRPEAAT